MRYVSVFCCSVFVMISFSSAHFFLKQGTIASCLKNTNVLHCLLFFAPPSLLDSVTVSLFVFISDLTNSGTIVRRADSSTPHCLCRYHCRAILTPGFPIKLASLIVKSIKPDDAMILFRTISN